MKVSYHWLKSYFDTELPSIEDVVHDLTFKSFEIEDVAPAGHDAVLDVKVLPNRGHDCLCHRGIATEIAAICNVKLADDPLRKAIAEYPASQMLTVAIDDAKLCDRYIGLVVRGVKVGPSPEWLKGRLNALGQRSINNIVDATNYVMFSIGQPLHAFDLAKLREKDGKRAIHVRNAKDGETITVLGGDEYTLGPSDLLITDGNADTPLAIAGVKGGTAAELTDTTTDIVLEAAHFQYAHVRKMAQRFKLWTDASTRFQNDPSPDLARYGIQEVAALIQQIAGGEVEGIVDVYPAPQQPVLLSISTTEINKKLGTGMSDADVETIWGRFGFSYQKEGDTYHVSIPFERLDLRITEDLVEEVGRIYGFDKIAPQMPTFADVKPEVNKRFAYAEKVRDVLLAQGFSEVYTTSFNAKGEVELANSVAPERKYLRTNLREGLASSLELNVRNLDLLGLDRVCIFEIGTVFTSAGEHMALALGAKSKNKKEDVSALVQGARDALSAALGTTLSGDITDGIWETDFDALVAGLADVSAYDKDMIDTDGVRYQPFSVYPFVARDVALWVPDGVSAEDVVIVLKMHAGDLSVCPPRLFDTFSKTFDDGSKKTSYAFRLVFQSHERTLTDAEVNDIVARVTKALEEQGWQVR